MNSNFDFHFKPQPNTRTTQKREMCGIFYCTFKQKIDFLRKYIKIIISKYKWFILQAVEFPTTTNDRPQILLIVVYRIFGEIK